MSEPGRQHEHVYSVMTLRCVAVEGCEAFVTPEQFLAEVRAEATKATTAGPTSAPLCEVYWGSHGCHRERGHDPALGHACDCCRCADHERDHEANGCVALPPYYGPDTRFYGADA